VSLPSQHGANLVESHPAASHHFNHWRNVTQVGHVMLAMSLATQLVSKAMHGGILSEDFLSGHLSTVGLLGKAGPATE